MARRRTPGDKPRHVRVLRTETELEQILDGLDNAMLANDRTRAQALIEQLWQARNQLPDVLTQRLIQGRARVPAFAFELLGGFAGQRMSTFLRRIAEDRSAPDIVRFGAQRRAGPPARGEAKRRRAFLETLADPDGTLILAIEQGTETWPPQVDILQEVLAYLVVLPSERRQAVVARGGQELGLRMSWMLHALLHVDDLPTQRFALSEISRLRDRGALGALGRLAKTTRHAELRAEATAAGRRLRLQVVDRSEPVEFPPFPPLDRVLLSAVDGEGAQMCVIVRKWGEGAFLITDFLWKDDWGIKDALGSNRVTDDQLGSMLAGFGQEEVGAVEVDLAVVRGLLADAVELNATTEHGIPPVFELWEPLAHETYPPAEDEPAAVPEIDDGPYANRQDLLRSSGKLFEHPFFTHWTFDPEALSAVMVEVPPPSAARWTDRQFRTLLERLVDPATRARLRRRLRRQAWLLGQSGKTTERDTALAVAAALAKGGPADLVKLPFLQQMVERSVARLLSSILFPAR